MQSVRGVLEEYTMKTIFNRFREHVREHEVHSNRYAQEPLKEPKTLPILALNEVFIGESLSAR